MTRVPTRAIVVQTKWLLAIDAHAVSSFDKINAEAMSCRGEPAHVAGPGRRVVHHVCGTWMMALDGEITVVAVEGVCLEWIEVVAWFVFRFV